ncbi:PREDICTED: cytosolic sulfotransferase 12-like [Fragaria vesca subsp. vesca]|uniref:cytosolic sulfotransferase 12-like n=1 Tax=Fragaria vesca subsp. vesca TaxID=101020 RepID=UPI0002C2E9B9|nr:PREDICTED: cytosolic sulfotransferase 12-like [Fragaria vesca subsp. vesca]
MSQTQPPPALPQYLQENDLSQETRDMISTLPRDQGWISNHVYQYQGFWLTTIQIEGVLSFQENFRAQDSDILLVATPKSGTTWLKAILFSLENKRGEYYHPEPQDHPLLTKNPHVLVPYLEIGLYLRKPVPDLMTSYAPPRLFSSHLPLVSLPESVKDSACKVVYLCRNPKDTVVSLWHFANRMRPESWGSISLEEALKMFCRGVSLYGPFWDHVLGYWNESLKRPESVFFITFAELKEQPGFQLRRLAEFLGCPFSPEEEAQGVVENISRLCSFENLSNLDVNKNGVEHSAFFCQLCQII